MLDVDIGICTCRCPHPELEFNNIQQPAVCYEVKGSKSFSKRTSCLAFPMIRYAANSDTPPTSKNCLGIAVVTLDVLKAGLHWTQLDPKSPQVSDISSGWLGFHGIDFKAYAGSSAGGLTNARSAAILKYYHATFDVVGPGGTPSTEM